MANTKFSTPPLPRFISERLNKSYNRETKTVARRRADSLNKYYNREAKTVARRRADSLNRYYDHEAKTVARRRAESHKRDYSQILRTVVQFYPESKEGMEVVDLAYPLSDAAKAVVGYFACWLKGTPLLDELRDLFRSHTDQMQREMAAAIVKNVLQGTWGFYLTGVKHVDVLVTEMIMKINDTLSNDL